MDFWTKFLRGYSYLFHLLLSAVMLVLGLVTYFSRYPLRLDQSPWTGMDVAYGLIILGVFGLLAVLLSFRDTLHLMYAIYAAGMFILLGKGYFFGRYFFDSVPEFLTVVGFVLAALVAAIGAYRTWRYAKAR